jgi:hypothetical protein
MECYVHNVPGRLRVRNVRFKDPETHDEIKRMLVSDIGKGIGTVEFNTTTGSVLIHYNPQTVGHQDILGVLHDAGYYDPACTVSNDQLVHSAASKALHLVTKSVSGAFVETALSSTGLSFLAVLL